MFLFLRFKYNIGYRMVMYGGKLKYFEKDSGKEMYLN